MKLSVLILAAGKGKRMATELPKVMHSLAGTPMLQRIYNTVIQLKPAVVRIVYHNQQAMLRQQFDFLDVEWVNQAHQLGTGHAVQQVLPLCADDEQILILCGDVPLIAASSLKKLLASAPKDGIGLLLATVKNPKGLGRIARDPSGDIVGIIEDRDADAAHREIKEISTGVLCCSARRLKQWLPYLQPDNNQKEYYLTSIIALAAKQSVPIVSVSTSFDNEAQGVNDLWQLANLERWYQQQQAKCLALSGVIILDPTRLDVRGDEVKVSADVTLDVNVVLEGKTRIGKYSKIGANCIIKDAEIGENVVILPYSHIDGAVIKAGSQVGPFARLRAGTILEEKTRVGNFVEMKKTHFGKNSKASHLTYLGDCKVGDAVNIGAGTVTCNYDGISKWETVIGNSAFIGSNASLVAPVVVGERATIGAGSTVSGEVPANQLTLARSRQISIKDWVSPRYRTEKQN